MLGLMTTVEFAGEIMIVVGQITKKKPLTITGLFAVVAGMAYTFVDIWNYFHEDEEES